MVKLIDVGGYRLAVSVTAGQDPPIVFISGIGDSQTIWWSFLTSLDCLNATVTYDRAGIGQSDPRPVNDRHLPYSELSLELVRMLDVIGITGPIVLVGHSLGVVIARSAAALFPDRIVGMVLIDGAVDDMILWPHSQPSQDGRTDNATLLDFRAGAAELAKAVYRPVPVIVLARTPGRWTSPQATPQVDARWSAQQLAVAEELGGLLIVADDSSHHVQDDAPALTALSIRAVVEAAQRGHSSVQLEPEHVERAGGRILHPSTRLA
jgi:pimeloyl-ACP methyl ester carboxylesterase